MRNETLRDRQQGGKRKSLPKPTPQFRRRAWREFQRALDPLSPIKPLRSPRPR